MKSKMVLALGIAAAVAATSTTAMAAEADGAKLFKKKCGVCHSMEPGKHKMGPSLAGVVGRKAGTAEGFSKYKAMDGASFTWTEDLLAEWITNQKKFLKAHADEVGNSRTSMSAKIRKEGDREAIIDYLKGDM